MFGIEDLRKEVIQSKAELLEDGKLTRESINSLKRTILYFVQEVTKEIDRLEKLVAVNDCVVNDCKVDAGSS